MEFKGKVKVIKLSHYKSAFDFSIFLTRSQVSYIVQLIFSRFAIMYGRAWSSQIKSEERRRILFDEWMLVIQTMTSKDILQVVQWLVSDKNASFLEFAPTPYRFRYLAKQIKLDELPVAEVAYFSIMRNEKVHDVVTQTTDYIGRDVLKMMSTQKGIVIFKKIYTEMCGKYIIGERVMNKGYLKKCSFGGKIKVNKEAENEKAHEIVARQHLKLIREILEKANAKKVP